MSKFNAMLEIYIAMSESIGFCCRYFENRERDFFLWYCLVSIKMDLKFNLIFYFFFFSPWCLYVAEWNIIFPIKDYNMVEARNAL